MTFKVYEVTVPVPPSVNAYLARGRGGRPRLTDEAKMYKQSIRLLVKGDPIEGPVAVNVSVFFGNKRRDLDNVLKVLLDAFEGIFYSNDNQISELHLFKYHDPDNPRCLVLVYEDLDD